VNNELQKSNHVLLKQAFRVPGVTTENHKSLSHDSPSADCVLNPRPVYYAYKAVCNDLYGCETWSVTLSEEHMLRVLENRVLRKIFRPNKYEIMGRDN
jgi:hypothetical protein